MKVLIVSEGKNEWGVNQQQSALGELARRILKRDVTLTYISVRDQSVKTTMTKGKFARYERRAVAWIRKAERDGFDAVILMVDQDGNPEISEGIDRGQGATAASLPRAMGVAIKSFDAWILADERALTAALRVEVQRQKRPELMNDPKRICQSLRDQSGQSLGFSEMYFLVCQQVNLNTLAERCPAGFAPFRERVEALALQ